MAQGSNLKGSGSCSGGTANFVAIQPQAGQEWIVTNIYYDRACTIKMVDVVNGVTTEIAFQSDIAANSIEQRSYHLTSDHYLKVYNGDATNTLNISYDGSYNN